MLETLIGFLLVLSHVSMSAISPLAHLADSGTSISSTGDTSSTTSASSGSNTSTNGSSGSSTSSNTSGGTASTSLSTTQLMQTTQATTSGTSAPTTKVAADLVPPSVLSFFQSTQPDGTILAAMQFTEAVLGGTVTPSNIYLISSSGQKLEGAPIASTAGASLHTDSVALFATDYRLVVRGIKDLAGNAMSEYVSPPFQRSGAPPAAQTALSTNTATSTGVITTAMTFATTAPPTVLRAASTQIVPSVRTANVVPEAPKPISTEDHSDQAAVATTSPVLPDTSASRTLATTDIAPPPPVTVREARELGDLHTSTRALEKATESLTRTSALIAEPATAPSAATTVERALNQAPRSDASAVDATAVADLRQAVQQRDGLDLYQDSDNDGISDYDEVHIYHTDPRDAHTMPGALTDGEKVLHGIDPVSASAAPVPVQSPITSGFVVNDLFSVDTIAVESSAPQAATTSPTTSTTTPNATNTSPVAASSTTTPAASPIRFSGRALPNSFVTLYIFSTPIVVTVKADSTGRWTYRLDKELPDGKHQLYVAMVDNSGSIIAKSPPVPFTKTAEALDYAPLVLPPVEDTDSRQSLMLKLALLGGGTALIMIGIVVLGIGMWRTRAPAV